MGQMYIVDGQDLTDLADAIREKTGESGSLTWPDDFTDGVSSISGDSAGRHIYGVRWTYEDDGDGTMILPSVGSYTDEAASFSAPIPFVAGSSQQEWIFNSLSCGSPFDNLYPWNGMIRVKDKLLVDMVAIPKFWYKWTKTASYLQLQVATYEAEGFNLSPAHRARTANETDRDVVYIARYHADSQMLQSLTGASPMADLTRAQFRAAISQQTAQLGQSGYSMQDYAMFWTWRMLYLVEYKNWNGQAAIGYDCGTGVDYEATCETCNGTGHVECPTCEGSGTVEETCSTCDGSGTDPSTGEMCGSCNGSGQTTSTCSTCEGTGEITCPTCNGTGTVSPEGAQTEPDVNGTTDTMPYHTGTMQATLATPGQGVQYRYIEDPWGGVAEWIDGWRAGYDDGSSESYCAVIMNPAQFSDTQNGQEIIRVPGSISGGWITDWYIPQVSGYDWALMPITDGSGYERSVADGCGFGGPALLTGGSWFAHADCGPFCLRSGGASNHDAAFGARLQKLP